MLAADGTSTSAPRTLAAVGVMAAPTGRGVVNGVGPPCVMTRGAGAAACGAAAAVAGAAAEAWA